MPSLLFPSVGLQVLSSIIHFLGVSVLSHCISRRLASENFSSWEGLKQTSWARICVLLIFIDSWLFLFSGGILIFGVGLEWDRAVCSAAIYLCIGFYATSKVLIYLFLVERVHSVWSPADNVSRFKSKVYAICLVTVVVYMVVVFLLLIGRVYFLREGDNACIIGLKPISSIPLLAYDVYINFFLTGLFLYPLVRGRTINPRTRRIARNALIAAVAALTTSTVNIAILASLSGHELGWLCLGSCGADVIFNALAIFAVTTRRSRRRESTVAAVSNASDLSRRQQETFESFTSLGSMGSMGSMGISQRTRPSSHISLTEREAKQFYMDNPFAHPVFISKEPLPETTVTATYANTVRPPSALRSFSDLFRKDRVMEPIAELQITVTTEIGVEHYVDIDNEDTHYPPSSHSV